MRICCSQRVGCVNVFLTHHSTQSADVVNWWVGKSPTHPTQLSEMFVVGKTTELQVSGKLGSPDSVRTLKTGEVWEYESKQHASVILLPIGFTTKTKLVFTFDKNGVLQSVDKLEAQEADGI